MKPFLRALRVDNYIKNTVILLPGVFGAKIFQSNIIGCALLSILLFSLLSSGIYLINDLADQKEDRLHPKKRFRPVASGEVSLAFAISASLFLLSAASIGAYLWLPKAALQLFVAYIALNFFYTFFLKKIILIEFFTIAIFFELRLFLGGIIADTPPSHWLILTTFFLAVLIALGKRRDDILLFEQTGALTRRSTDAYNRVYLDSLLTIFASSLVLIYVLYTISEPVMTRFSPYFYTTNIFVLLGLSRYLQQLFVKSNSGNPIHLLLKDRYIQFCVLMWVVLVLYFIYVV
jgi:4-hydroxybenzoate polyprenyltransferase